MLHRRRLKAPRTLPTPRERRSDRLPALRPSKSIDLKQRGATVGDGSKAGAGVGMTHHGEPNFETL